ncbi:hypothetical protein Tco_0731326 [Tanacetum coccineum]
MAGQENDTPPPPPPPTQTPVVTQTPHTMSTIKLPILKKGEYDIWAMKMEHYLAHTNYPIWEVIQKGNGPRKARTTLLMALLEDHLVKFHKMADAKDMWDAIKSRFGGNDKSKKMQNQLEIHGAGVSIEDANQKFFRSLPSSWSQVSLVMRTKQGVDSLNFDDLYNNLKVFESDVKGSTASSSSTQNVAFISSESTNSINDISTAYGASPSSGHNSQRESFSSYTDDLILKGNQDARRRDVGNSGYKAKDNGRRPGKQEESKALVTLDGEGIDWTAHAEDEEEKFALITFSNSGSDTKQNQLWYEEKIKFIKIDLDDKTDVLTYHKKLLAAAEKEKEELKTRLKKWQNSSKGLNKLLNSQMSVRDKAGLGSSDTEDSPVNDRYAEGMHVVPPPMTGIYIPSGPDKEINESQFTYGPKQSKPSESDTRSSDFNSCESNSSEETLESLLEPVVNEPKVEQPSFAFVNTAKHVKTPRETVKNQHPYSQSLKVDKRDCNGLMSQNMDLGYGFTMKACFVRSSFSHLIRDCDFHEKRMAKQAELDKRMCKGTGQRENRPVWNNVQRVNHQNQFVPTAVLTRIGRIPVNTARASSTNNVNTARASSTNNVNTARHNFNSQAVPTNAAKKVNTVKPIVNSVRPKNVFHKTHSPIRRPFKRTTTPKTNLANQKVNTAGDKAVSAILGIGKTAVKPSADCV